MSETPLKIEALVYDAYGTLFDTASVIARCDHHFPGHGPAISDIWRTKQLEYTWLRSLMGIYRNFWGVTEDGVRFACRSLGLELKDDILSDLMENYLTLTPYPEVPGALKTLAETRKQAVLSNGSPEMLNKVVENNGLRGYLEAVLSVDEAGIFKPSPKVYQLAVDHLGVRPSAVGFVSSNCWDAIGAKAFGFQVFWINRFNRPLDEMGIVPDREIRTLDDIHPLLG